MTFSGRLTLGNAVFVEGTDDWLAWDGKQAIDTKWRARSISVLFS